MKNTKEQFGITGRVRVTAYKAGTQEVLRQTPWVRNLIVSSSNRGRNLIAQRLASINSYSLNVTHGELGTGTTAPANNDTALMSPSDRVATTYKSVTNNAVLLQFFWSDADLANGTYREFGTFIDGSATLGSGQLFNRALFGTPYTKATGEDTTVEVEFTIN